MLRLPICPYCGYKFSYSRSAKALREKQVKCKKCGKLMSISYKLSAVRTAVCFFIFLIFLNTVYLFHSKSRTIIPNFVFTLLFILLYFLIIPLKVKFKKIPGQEDHPEKLKKNRHRHKKTKNIKTEADENPIKNTTFED